MYVRMTTTCYFICAGPEVKTHAQSSADGRLGVEIEASSGVLSEDAETQPPSYEAVLLQQKQEKEERVREVGQPSQKAVAFEVALSSDGQFMAKKPPPRRLEVRTVKSFLDAVGISCCLCG